MADYNIKDIYEGSQSAFDYSKGDSNANRIFSNDDNAFTGYVIPAGELGVSMNPTTANQIGELNKTINQGVIPIEVGVVDPKVFDVIPKQHFKEMGRMAELTGTKISVHAPVIGIEPSGLDPQGRQQWTEQSRQAIEEQLKSVVDKTMTIDNVGGTPITVHASNIPLAEWEKRDGEIIKTKDMVVNQETGQMSIAELSDMYRPGMLDTKEEDFTKITEQLTDTMTPKGAINSMNNSQWRKSILEATMGLEKADEILRETYKVGKPIVDAILHDQMKMSELTQPQRDVYLRVMAAEEQMTDSKLKIDSLFDKSFKYGDEKQQKVLAQAAQTFSNNMPKRFDKIEDKIDWLKKTNKEELKNDMQKHDLTNQTQSMRQLIHKLEDQTPEQFVSATEFATKKSAETFANVALHSYDEAIKKSKKIKKDIDPAVISIENMFQGLGFARGEDMKNLIVNSRDNFVKKFVKDGKGSETKAKAMAEKIIGMTFDVGHLNVFKKSGYTDADLVKEAEEVAQYVKHIHITDNFGYDDSHLPPGMGNVPMEDLLQALEAGDPKARKIVEAGNFNQQFQMPSFAYNLEGMGSPMFKGGGPQSYWGQSYFDTGGGGISSASLQRGYFGGYGGMLPQLNYETFGAGFAQLPSELGGQRMGGGQGSRMSGKPME